jgi:lipoprotein-anchoring transpeptidase ErfK/SrfK
MRRWQRTLVPLAACGALAAAVLIWLLVRDGDDAAPGDVVTVVAPGGSAPEAQASPPAPPRAEPNPPLRPRAAGGSPHQAGGTASPVEATASPVKGGSKSNQPARDIRAAVPARGHPILWVRAGQRVELHQSPGGEVAHEVGRRTEFGSPTVYSIAARRGRWAGVPTPYLANDQLAWVRLDRRKVGIGATRYAIAVDLSARRAQVRHDGRVISDFPVTVGMPGAETPTGRFAVTDTFRGGLDPAYGCCAVALTARQPHLPSGWIGGNRIAIHGTAGPLGIAASHGCVRAPDSEVSKIVDRVPLGSPVVIHG